MFKIRSTRVVYPMVALGVALVVSACGGGSPSSSSTSTTPTQAAVVSSTTSAAPQPRLETLSPRAGSHVGSNVTVRVALVNRKATGPKPFRYVLDGLTRFGPRRLTFHGVKPGHHRLIVTLVDDRAVRSQTLFVVKAPPPSAVTTHATSTAPSPTTTAAPSPTTTAAPAPPPPTTSTTTAPAPPPPTTSTTTAAPPTKTTSPPAGGGIPQGGGGDGDGDNSGAPSDGDGNI